MKFNFQYMNPIKKEIMKRHAENDQDFHNRLVELEPFWEPDFDGMMPNGIYMVRCLLKDDIEKWYKHMNSLDNPEDFLCRIPLDYLLIEGYRILNGYPVVDVKRNENRVMDVPVTVK